MQIVAVAVATAIAIVAVAEHDSRSQSEIKRRVFIEYCGTRETSAVGAAPSAPPLGASRTHLGNRRLR